MWNYDNSASVNHILHPQKLLSSLDPKKEEATFIYNDIIAELKENSQSDCVA